MEKFCVNHPSKKALSFCHNCGENFCQECLNEGLIYYFCDKKQCYAEFLNEKENAQLNIKKIPYADIFSRFIAFLLDGVILFLFNTVLITLLRLEPLQPGDIFYQSELFVIFRHPLFYTTGFLYFVLMECSPIQATIGKRMQNLIVTNLEGERISFLKAFIRNISKVLSTLFFFFGYIMIWFTKKQQSLHDMLAKTLIIKLGKDNLPAEIVCSECQENVRLNAYERVSKEYDCPNCNKKVNFK